MTRLFIYVCAAVGWTLLTACGGGSTESPPGPNPLPTGNCVAGLRASGSVQLVDAFPNLSFNQPLAMIPAPSGNLVYVVQRGGVIRAVENTPNATTTTTFLTINSNNITTNGEGGLLGMAFDINYANNGYVYVSYTAPVPAPLDGVLVMKSRIVRFTANAARTALQLNTETLLLEIDQPYSNHNGGQIAVDNQGLLYIGIGDGGSGNDPLRHGQNTETLLGAMLRIDPRTPDTVRNKPYRIPSGNPFANNMTCSGGCPEIFAWGLRNPWRWSFDRATRALWVGDVGQGALEEIDLVEAGKNYGWGCFEGTRRNTNYGGNCPANLQTVAPRFEYGRNEGVSVTGGYIYRGSALQGFTGQYIFSDFGSGTIWAVANPYDNPQRRVIANGSSNTIASLAEDAQGELYVIYLAQGRIFKLASNPNNNPAPAFAAKLSQSGCANPANPKQVVSGMVPFEVNAPLWSDNAEKQRWFSLPDNRHIQVELNQDWTFPIGSVLRKDFYLGTRIVETRLFARHVDGEWVGYSYEWNAAQSDATLLTDAKSVQVGNQMWHYPSPSQCMQCHSHAAGRSLSPETAQLNRTIVHPVNGANVNQLDYLQSLNVFGAALPNANVSIVDYRNTQLDPALRARAYLHANCSNCHQPGGPGRGNLDLRHTTTLANMAICNVPPSLGPVNNATRLLSPLNTADSVIYQRMRDLGAARMPPIGSAIEDTLGTTVLSDWIMTLANCP